MTGFFKVSAVQFGARHFAPDVNRATIEESVRAEAQNGASLIVLPELATCGYCLDEKKLRDCSESAKGPTHAHLQGLSDELGIIAVCGFCETGENGELFNSAILVSPERPPVIYRKLHLFDREKDIFAPGDRGLVVADTHIGRIGICVCYDLRFVEVARGLSLVGADLLAVPTAWVGGFDKSPRDEAGYIGQARGALVQANLDQLPMICASQAGGDQGTRFLGSSLIVDAQGTCLAGPMGEDETGTISAEMSIRDIHAARVRSPLVRPRDDRRRDVYGIMVGEERL